jgi:hypothetical protein
MLLLHKSIAIHIILIARKETVIIGAEISGIATGMYVADKNMDHVVIGKKISRPIAPFFLLE